MKKIVLLLALCALPVMSAPKEADKTPSQMVMAAYESVLSGTHSMLADVHATKYINTLIQGLEPMVAHLDEINGLADDIEKSVEWNAALAEYQPKITELTEKVVAAAQPYSEIPNGDLKDALEDLVDEIEDMQKELQPK